MAKQKAKTKAKGKSTSSRSALARALHNVAGVVPKDEVKSATSDEPLTSVQKESKHMSDDELGSIIEFSEDIATAEAPDLLPVSEYEAPIKGVETKVSQAGRKYAAVTFYIGTDQFPADYVVENNPDGLSLIFRGVPLEDNPRARFQLRQFLAAIGAKASKRIDTSEWIGLAAKVGLGHDEYEGVNREVIKKVSAL